MMAGSRTSRDKLCFFVASSDTIPRSDQRPGSRLSSNRVQYAGRRFYKALLGQVTAIKVFVGVVPACKHVIHDQYCIRSSE
jgi:hypothetical protein